VKAAVPIYGCGWESYAFPVDVKAPASEDQRLWRALMAPEAYAPRITAPLLFMSATNDGHGKMDLAYNTLDLLASKTKRQVFTPQHRGRANEVLAIDVHNDWAPETLTIILRHRRPGQYGQEYRFSAPSDGEKERTRQPWRTLHLKREQFQAQDGTDLPDWEMVDWFILKGTSAAGKPPVFRRLRWEGAVR
jgi:hypothetical protein